MQLLLFCGVQASGKSSYYKAHFADTHIRLNLDMLRTRHREALLFHACLQAKQPCVIDNTNPTAAARAKYLEPARAAHFQSIAYYFETPLADALARNATRSGKARIPERGIIATYKQLEPPTLAEGIAAIYRVRLDPQHGYLTEKIDEI